LNETTNADGLDQQCSGGVYPRLNGGQRRFPPTNRLSEFINKVAKLLAGINPATTLVALNNRLRQIGLQGIY